jgi:hypothetical protein
VQVQQVNMFFLRIPLGCDRLGEAAGWDGKGRELRRLDRAPIERHGPAVAKAFSGEARSWPDGGTVTLFDLGDDNPTRAAFYSTFVGRSAAQVKAAWAQLVFSGKATPPKVVDGDAEVKKAVAANKLAVGYIKPSSVDDTVKVLLR